MACVLFAVLPCATALGIPLASVGTATGSYVVQASYIQVCTMARARAAAVGPICTLAVAWSTVVSHVTTGVWAVAAVARRTTGPRRDSSAPSPAAMVASPRPARSTRRRLIGRSKAGSLSSYGGMVSLSFVYLPLSTVKRSSHHFGQDPLDLRLCRQRDHSVGPAG